MNQSNLPISSLDFDGIKNNLKTYLQGQTAFKDYDFEGSALNIILDLLAYNTHYQAFYANMVANETFIDSAVKRASVVSLAKLLGYTPRSNKASRVTVNLNFGNNTNLVNLARTGALFINKGDLFVSLVNNNTLAYLPLEQYRLVVEDGEVLAKNVVIYEGRLKTTSYVVNIRNENARYTIPSSNVDIDTITVKVQKSASDSTGLFDVWTRATDINNLDSESKVFFIQEAFDGKYEVYFGDGVIGQSLDNGNLVIIEYLITNGVGGNGASTFSYAGAAGNGILPSVSTILDPDGNPTKSYGGNTPESIGSMKYYAPRNYQAQERAVTATDYETLLAREYSDQADSFLVWGGEENDPPEYGKVFISMKPKNGTKISDDERFSIEQTILGRRNLVSITPTVVNPDYTYIVPTITVYYDINKTTLSKDSLEKIVRERMNQFETENLLAFGRSFRASKFSAFIDSAYSAFNSTSVSFSLQKRLEPLIGRSLNYTIKFDNAITHPIDGYPSVVSTSGFGYQDLTSSLVPKPTVTGFMQDDGFGRLNVYKIIGTTRAVITEVGTIDYANGTLNITNFNPLSVLPTSTNEVNFTVETSVNDINARRNQIILFDRENAVINLIPETFRTDRNETGAPFPR